MKKLSTYTCTCIYLTLNGLSWCTRDVCLHPIFAACVEITCDTQRTELTAGQVHRTHVSQICHIVRFKAASTLLRVREPHEI